MGFLKEIVGDPLVQQEAKKAQRRLLILVPTLLILVIVALSVEKVAGKERSSFPTFSIAWDNFLALFVVLGHNE